MYRFSDDYSEGAHPRILAALAEHNLESNPGYGLDRHSARAADLIRKEAADPSAEIHFLAGGTQANSAVIASALRPYQAVIAASTGHINVHETGAAEASGHKVLTAESADGKLNPSMIRDILSSHTDEHMVQPKMVYISDSTETGTIYTREELAALYHFCGQNGLYLFLDGARLGAALASPENDLTIADVAALTDIFYIGGTKNGALLGEALVIINDELKPGFRFLMKQRGAMLAKGWILGIQFEELFQDGLYYRLAAQARESAETIQRALEKLGYEFAYPPQTNQLFPIVPDPLAARLEAEFGCHPDRHLADNRTSIRIVTSWASTEAGIRSLLRVMSE